MSPNGGERYHAIVQLRLWIWAMSGVATLVALEPSRKLWHYGFAQWQDRDGLPQNTVQAIAQTADGYLWLGTEAGLVRFNGRKFRTFDPSNEPAIRSNSVPALAARPDGGLWIGTRSGLVLYQAGRFVRWGTAEGLRNETVRALALRGDGKLWVGTNGGVGLFDGQRFEHWITREQGLASNGVRALAGWAGELWIGTGNGLSVLRDGAERATPVSGMPVDTIRAITRDRQGRVWIGTETSGLFVAEPGGSRVRRFQAATRLSSDSIRALLEDRDGHLWIGTVGGGLHRQARGELEGIKQAQGLPSDHVRSIFEDREGSIWVGMEAGGLAQFKEGRAITWSAIDGLRSEFIRAVRADAKGELWVGTEGGGLFRLSAGRLIAAPEKALERAFVTAILPARDGALWIGTEGQGAFRVGAGRTKTFSTAYGLSENSVWALAEERDGTIWLGSSNGLVRVRGGEQQVFRTADGLRGNSIRSLHAAADGSLWIGNRSAGLQRWRNGRFENVELPAGARHAGITGYREEPDGTIWMSSSQGILHWDGQRIQHVGARHGLPSESLFQVLDDGAGRLWFSSSRGLFSVDREALKRVWSGQADRVRVAATTTADGLRSSECSGDAQPAGWRTEDGSLWFATIRGLAQIPPAARAREQGAPPVVIEGAEVNGRAAPWRAAGVSSPAGNRLFTVRFAALSYLSPERTRYRYRLRGQDERWVEVTDEQEATYQNLPPGGYVFEVQAAHPDGEWGTSAAAVSLSVAPFWYETPWFWGTVVFLVGMAAYAWHRQRTQRMEREFSAVLGERARIAREIHDTLLQGFAGATLQLSAIAKRLNQDPAAAQRALDGVLDQIDGCLAEARQEIGELRETAGPTVPLPERLQRAAAAVCAGSGISVQFVASGTERALGPELDKSLLRIARESVANAVRHARPRTVRLELEYRADRVRFAVRDDGQGLSAAEEGRSHFGIVGMRERTKLLGGSFALRSEPNRGTEIEVILPVRGNA